MTSGFTLTEVLAASVLAAMGTAALVGILNGSMNWDPHMDPESPCFAPIEATSFTEGTHLKASGSQAPDLTANAFSDLPTYTTQAVIIPDQNGRPWIRLSGELEP